MIALLARFILAPLASLWRWLTESPSRLVIAALIALSAFLAWRLSSVDGDRDKWRDLVKQYEDASRIVSEADAAADAEALDVANQTKDEIDAGNERAADAARDSADPLADGFRSLRAEKTGGNKAAK